MQKSEHQLGYVLCISCYYMGIAWVYQLGYITVAEYCSSIMGLGCMLAGSKYMYTPWLFIIRGLYQEALSRSFYS